jgi:beta-fructofuranosidase
LANMPQYHIFGGSCDLNDANGIFLDPATNLYHMFFQDHLAEAGGSGPTWGHLVSHDLAHWARLPVAIWNDQAYDDKAIYTGSATIVDGIPTQLYPGICTKGSAACETGVTLAIAVPTNRSDPLLVNWTKPSYNPVIAVSPAPPGSGPYSCGDPSTAWRTASGEWRVATRDTLNSSLFGSADFKKWYHIGRQPGFTSANPTESGACPSVFPLPRTTVGTAAGTINGRTTPTPTHCYMHTTHANGTTIECGTYIDGLPAGPGHSTATVGEWTTSMSHQRVDRGECVVVPARVALYWYCTANSAQEFP